MYGQALCWPEFHHSLGSGFPPLWRLSVGSFPEHWLVMEPNPVSRVACEGNVSVEFSAFRILDVCAVKNAQTETFPAQA